MLERVGKSHRQDFTGGHPVHGSSVAIERLPKHERRRSLGSGHDYGPETSRGTKDSIVCPLDARCERFVFPASA